MLQTISLLVENKPGALMRITGVLSARGWNIDSLTVARTLDAAQSRMTIVVDIDPVLRRQVMKQMNKLINVLQASDLTESLAVRREMALVRGRATPENRAGILRDAEIYGARVVDATADGFGLECTGPVEKVEEFIDAMKTFGDIDVTRSGIVAVSMESRKLRLAPPVQAGANGASLRPRCRKNPRVRRGPPPPHAEPHSSCRTSPCRLTITALTGTFRELSFSASTARPNNPRQHGTCMIATVRVLIFDSSNNPRTFST